MNANSEIDRFKPIFKYYKSKIPSPKMDKVIDILKGHEVLEELQSFCRLYDHLYLKDSKDWKLFKLTNGIHIIANPFKNEGISYWTLRCLKDFSASRNNLKNETIWWNQVQTDSKVTDKLRWATLGFHHDWDTKVYTEQGDFPVDLAELSKSILNEIPGLSSDTYKSEAAIINYYPMDSTLSGHVDFSEPNKSAPLISISFGQSAIFLIGGPNKNIEPSAIFLRNGDVLVMSHEARQSYHAVPKILNTENIENLQSDQSDFVQKYLENHRINMNVRQVF